MPAPLLNLDPPAQILENWSHQTHTREFMNKTARLFTVLLLSTDSTHEKIDKKIILEGSSAAANTRSSVRNPVLLALQLVRFSQQSCAASADGAPQSAILC